MSYLISQAAALQDGTVVDFQDSVTFTTGKGINDSNDNEELVFVVTGSAVNHFQITNAATGTDPGLAAVGDDSNINFAIDAKGTGSLNVNSVAGSSGNAINLYASDGKYFGLKNASGNAGDQDYTLPTAAPAANGYVLSCTTAGVMSWAADSLGFTYNYSVAASFTAAAGNGYAIGDVGGTLAVALPAISGLTDGDVVAIKDIAGKFDGQAATLTPNGTDTIDGASSLVLDGNYQSVTLRADKNTTTWGIW